MDALLGQRFQAKLREVTAQAATYHGFARPRTFVYPGEVTVGQTVVYHQMVGKQVMQAVVRVSAITLQPNRIRFETDMRDGRSEEGWFVWDPNVKLEVRF